MRPVREKLNADTLFRSAPIGCALRQLGIAIAIGAVAGCASLTPDQNRPEPLLALQNGEALVQTTSGRLFVTGLDAAYELRGLASSTPRLVPLPVRVSLPPRCQFTGATLDRPWLYVVCTTGNGSHLLRGRLDSEQVQLTETAELPNVAVANGLAAGDKALYVADSRQSNAAITRITVHPSRALTVDAETWLRESAGGLPNGLAYAEQSVYLTSAGHLIEVPVETDGNAGTPRIITNRLTFLDGIEVFPQGFLVTDYGYNRLLFIDRNGLEQAAFGKGSKGPTAVLLHESSATEQRVLVTEREAGRLSRLSIPAALEGYLPPRPDSAEAEATTGEPRRR